MKLSVAVSFLCLASASAFAPSSVKTLSTKLFNDPNQDPFGGKSLEFKGNESDDSSKPVRLRDRLNEADTDRRKEEDAAAARERASEIAREERLAKIAYMENMPEDTPAGTVDEFMFKEGVQDQLDKLDRELVGLIPVKKRVKEIAALLVLDKMRRKLGFETACSIAATCVHK